jgi:hypothetical protein
MPRKIDRHGKIVKREELSTPRANDPKTKAEWQEAVDAADFWLKVDSLRKYGLLCGGPTIEVERCESILQRGEKKGVFPTPMPNQRLVSR